MPTEAGRDFLATIAGWEEALRPATERQIAVVLGRLSIHFGAADRPEEHHRLAYEDWLLDVAEYPLTILDQAATEWRRSKPWAPKICEMRALCDALLGQRRTELLRLRFLAWSIEHHGGRCPRLLRRIGDRLVDYSDAMTDHIIEAALAGRTEFPPGDLVLAVPGAAPRPTYDHVDFRQLLRPMPPGEPDNSTANPHPPPLPVMPPTTPSSRRRAGRTAAARGRQSDLPDGREK